MRMIDADALFNVLGNLYIKTYPQNHGRGRGIKTCMEILANFQSESFCDGCEKIPKPENVKKEEETA